MPERTLLVRTLVQHDTGGPGGMKFPGDQYSRLASDAGYLMAKGVVELVNAPTPEDKLAAYGAVVIPIGETGSSPPWPPTVKSLDEWTGPYV